MNESKTYNRRHVLRTAGARSALAVSEDLTKNFRKAAVSAQPETAMASAITATRVLLVIRDVNCCMVILLVLLLKRARNARRRCTG